MVKKYKDVVGEGCVKDRDGNIAISDTRIKEVGKEHFENLLNEEFEWNKEGLEEVRPVSGPAELITVEEVRAATAKANDGKAAGPSGLVSEMLTASGEAAALWMTGIFNAIVREGHIPADWKKSWMVNVNKGKGGDLQCGSYRGIKLLEPLMKVFEWEMEKRVRN